MSSGGTTTGERVPRRGRFLIPRTTPRRAEFVAALGVLVVLAHLVFAQLTIVLAIIFYTITKITRWRPQWLAVPAAVGVVWALAIGPATAVAGLLAGPRHVVAYLGGVSGAPARVLHLGAAFGGMGEWLPRQFPLALVTGAAEAAIAVWLSWLHTDEWRLPTPRPGAVIAIRRWYLARVVRAGGVVTRDGACLGIAAPGGGRAALSWDEVAPGVLCTGAGGSGTTSTSFQLVHAAIRRRKPVIAVDLSGSRQLAEWFAIVCGATGTPLQVFAATGPVYYEPLRGGDPGRRAALVMGMIDWAGTADQYRRSCGAYLNDLFAVTDAAPGDPRTPMLDEVLHLLNPAALRARAQHVPGFHPHREALIERVKVSASLFEADPQTDGDPGRPAHRSCARPHLAGGWRRLRLRMPPARPRVPASTLAAPSGSGRRALLAGRGLPRQVGGRRGQPGRPGRHGDLRRAAQDRRRGRRPGLVRAVRRCSRPGC